MPYNFLHSYGKTTFCLTGNANLHKCNLGITGTSEKPTSRKVQYNNLIQVADILAVTETGKMYSINFEPPEIDLSRGMHSLIKVTGVWHLGFYLERYSS